MSLRTTALRVTSIALVTALAVMPATRALATTYEEQAAADRAAVTKAMAAYDAAQAEATKVDASLAEATAQLDVAIAEEARCQQQLQARAVTMYRSGDAGTLALVLGASDLIELESRLDMLVRLARHDADNLVALKAAQAEAEETALGLLELQAEQVKALEALQAEVDRARADLANSEAAVKAYEARRAAAAKAAAEAAAAARAKAAARSAITVSQAATGSGAWRTAVASHYSKNFTGRGASGAVIGPYTMMVAHKTLPFGTLIEFEYNGKRAVASVQDRGPYVAGREFDLGPGVVRALGFNGVHEVRYRIISR